MQRAVCFLIQFCAAASFAISGMVSTLDGRKLEGELDLTRDGLVVKLPQGGMVTVAASNIALATFSTNAAAAQTKGAGNGLLGIYFASTNFSGGSVIRLDEIVDFDWRGEAPVLGIPRDHFSVRWMGELEAPTTETYTIHFGSDEGGRIYFDGKLAGEQWTRRAYEETNFTVNLKAGEKHKIQIEYFDSFGGARARLWWSTPSMPKTIIPRDRLYAASFDAVHKADITGTEGLLATYYNSPNFTSYSFTRIDQQIHFDWRGVEPAPGISSNQFSVRWSGNLLITNSGEYTFHLLAGRPIRFFINNKVLNDPSLASAQKSCTATLKAGERCEVRLELNATNGAVGAQLWWSGPGIEKSLVPREHLSPAIAPAGSLYSGGTSTWPAGVVLLNGAIIAAPVRSASDAAIRLQGVLSKQSLPLAKVARIHVKPLSNEMAAALPSGRVGVLLRNRDFIDGDFAGIENGRVRITSVLFGNRTFDMVKDVVAIVLRGNEPAGWQYSISARDGTVLYGRSLVIEPTRIFIHGALEFFIPAAELTRITRQIESN